MNGFNFPEIGPVSPDVVLRNTVNAATLRAAESLPELKQQAQYGIPPSQEAMFDAVTADLTVKRVGGLAGNRFAFAWRQGWRPVRNLRDSLPKHEGNHIDSLFRPLYRPCA